MADKLLRRSSRTKCSKTYGPVILRARQFEFLFPRPALVMGVVNVTPDSFSDGGRFLDPEAAADQALELIEQGADIIDIGGESTRPRAEPVNEAEELKRVLPVLERLAGRVQVPISIDTQKPGVARRALECGASFINDIAANRQEPEMWEIAAGAGAGYVLMHMQGTPLTMQIAPTYGNVVRDIREFFQERLSRVEKSGLSREQVVLDPGIGFGKTVEQNLELLGGLNGFNNLGRPLLMGASRKSFMGRLLNIEVEKRAPAGLACACWAVLSGVQIVRTHDVEATGQALRMLEAILAHKNA